MNKLYMIGVLLVLVYWGTSCQDIPIGYLQTEDAGYNPDTMVVKNVNSLDDYPGEPNPEFQMYLDMGYTAQQITEWFGIPERINAGEDYVRSKWGAPWVSTPIEGVEGSKAFGKKVEEAWPKPWSKSRCTGMVLSRYPCNTRSPSAVT